ncbi:MAG: hypothetical protein ACYSTT_04505 [Planctomycetota bacterium]|jgi:hypothetical protein
MKMIKRTLIAIAVVALLVTSVHAAIEDPYYFSGPDDHKAIKVDGSDKPTIRWPYKIVYDELVVCNIPIKMKVGMFVQVKDCKDKKIILEQVNCADIGKGADEYPCYHGCVEFDVRANFEVKMGSALHKDGDAIKEWEAYYDGGDVVPGDGDWHPVKLCVIAWKTTIYKVAPGDEVTVGSVDVTVKPN